MSKNIVIGTLDAESDDEFLKDCFIQTPQYEDLKNFNNNKMILLGRTGVGKTALIRKLELEMVDKNGYFIKVKPDFIGLQYQLNSTLVDLIKIVPNTSIIYKAIWLHKIAVVIIDNIYGDRESFLKKVETLFKGSKEEKKLKKIITDFEHTFFESDKNLFESETIKANLAPKIMDCELGNIETQKTKQMQTDITQFINTDLIKNLESILELIRRDLSKDPKKKIIIAIDDLDTNWAIDDKTKYELIAALIQTVRFFSMSRNYSSENNFKLVVAIRTDLYKKACEEQKTVQTEKMDSLTTGLYWDESSLQEMLMARLQHSFQYRYSKKTTVKIEDLFVEYVEEMNVLDYLIERTMLRPRDLIEFVNFCFEESKGEKVEVSKIKMAESRFKTSRHDALIEEWASSYPELEKVLSITRSKLGNQFRLQDVLETLDFFIDKIQNFNNTDDALCLYFADNREPEDKAYELIKVLYLVGIIGILNQDTSKYDFVSHKKPTLKNIMIEEFEPTETHFKIHPLFERKEANMIG